MPRRGRLLPLAVAGLLGLLAGCDSRKPPPGPAGLFEVHCARCHAQAGEPGGPGIGGSTGPDLSKITARPGRTAEYLANFIRDPKSVDPDAKIMPAFADTLTEDEIKSLAEWLAAKKK
jgi:mono/diheme cytochrome c family protein